MDSDDDDNSEQRLIRQALGSIPSMSKHLRSQEHNGTTLSMKYQQVAICRELLAPRFKDYDSLLSGTQPTVHSKLVNFQKDLVSLQAIEDDPKYWEAISSPLAVGWLDIAVKMLRLHGQLDQLGNREVRRRILVH
ncbi:Nuclear pore complex protein NUP85 [Camellia lanceoleosa]|uniref:Nuclear pore complex protein NUP85 n=1 Tax=Camellia lanceoleosa TaxID=1840588 RepID=A0ACC0J1J7_9ERIC|nr:Nuclear pore complex protein NUP85 [Camellia lanceoleosa]